MTAREGQTAQGARRKLQLCNSEKKLLSPFLECPIQQPSLWSESTCRGPGKVSGTWLQRGIETSAAASPRLQSGLASQTLEVRSSHGKR
jgi:hypothetical protein